MRVACSGRERGRREKIRSQKIKVKIENLTTWNILGICLYAIFLCGVYSA
jgi:hypothetical protein